MISVRRLRAVLVFATISSIAWTIIGTILINGYLLIVGHWLALASFGRSQLVLAALGFAVGVAWAMTVAGSPRDADGKVKPTTAAAAGALGGALVALGISIAMGGWLPQPLAALLWPMGIMAAIGGTVGLLIQQVARRGALPPAPAEPPAIER